MPLYVKMFLTFIFFQGTELVEGLAVDLRSTKAVSLSTNSFAKMRYLKLLQINGVNLVGCFKNISKELIWLCWHECPLTSLPSNFQLDNLVVLDMQHSHIKELKVQIYKTPHKSFPNLT